MKLAVGMFLIGRSRLTPCLVGVSRRFRFYCSSILFVSFVGVSIGTDLPISCFACGSEVACRIAKKENQQNGGKKMDADCFIVFFSKNFELRTAFDFGSLFSHFFWNHLIRRRPSLRKRHFNGRSRSLRNGNTVNAILLFAVLFQTNNSQFTVMVNINT